ncbi:alpha-2-macroglobulin family protein [Mucilaginibacter panaciglaebae]|uniref:Alpha-2-macroglobulin domain-containing protein n=1 Tax=Mucilaginibacter panaciglaebae TaxID=502331 RepID=A0ABP7X0L3_9SPHI
MKKSALLFLFVLVTLSLFAQKRLLDSRERSVYTYIYRLDDASTLLFLTGHQNQIKDNALTHEVARFLTDHPDKLVLPAGNYLKVAAVHNKLNYKLIQNHNAQLVLMDNDVNSQFILVDSAGNTITDAKPYIGKKAIPYDVKAETYHIKRPKKDSIYRLSYKGVSNFFKVTEDKYRYYYTSSTQKTSWLTNVWKKIRAIFSTPEADEIPNYRRPVGYPGYTVLNKPKYRPGDTVKLKAFILQKKSKLPLTEKKLAVRLYINGYQDDEPKLIGYADAYRNGGFDFQFKLTDSLDLDLDSRYMVSLESVDSIKRSKKQKNVLHGGDDHKYIIYQTGMFQYEDYNLKSNRLNIRVSGRAQSPGNPIAIYLRANDENDLNIPDGRVNLVFTRTYATEYGADHIFIPDTLWQHELKLDPLGETKLIIPDSIFPKATLNFNANFKLLSSDNQLIQKYESFSWNYHPAKLDVTLAHDTLKARYLINGKSSPANGMLTRILAGDDTLKAIPVRLPLDLKFKGNALSFIVTADTLSATAYVNAWRYNLNKLAYRTRDSIFIDVQTDAAQKFWYTIFTGKKIFDQGASTDLHYKKPLKYSGPVLLRINPYQGGVSNNIEETVPFINTMLNVSVNQPAVVSPGLKTNIEVTVKDYQGKPVPNADLTAFAITSKFEDYVVPKIPYLGDRYDLKHQPLLIVKKLTDTGKLKLNWQYWAKSMGLDTIEYYKFTHTDSIYRQAGRTGDTITQVSPFVVMNGDIQPVHILYVDESPVYFWQTEDMHRYSFAVTPGKHSLRFRTAEQNIVLNNVEVKKGERLILALNPAYSKNSDLSVKPMPDTLTRYEQSILHEYTIGVDLNFRQHMATITQNGRVYLLNYMTRPAYYAYNPLANRVRLLIGPLLGNSNAMFNIKDNFTHSFQPEGRYSFLFAPDLIKEKTLDPAYYRIYLKNRLADTNYHQNVLTLAETDTIWRDYVDERIRNNYVSKNIPYNNTWLSVKPGKPANGKEPYVKAILVYKNNDPNFLEVHPGRESNLGMFFPDRYRILFLFKDNSYYLMENVVVKPNGFNYYNAGIIQPHQPDSVSLKIYATLRKSDLNYMNDDAKAALRQAFNEKYMDISVLTGEMGGRVVDSMTKAPLTGALITVEGTGIKTIAGNDGKFRIKVPKDGQLVIKSAGYETTKVKIAPGEIVSISLTANPRMAYDEIYAPLIRQTRDQTTGSSYVITGYSDQSPGVEQLLQGKVAGLNIQNNTPTGKLYIVDGVKIMLNGKDFVMDTKQIASRSELTPEAAMAIYGNEGALGVVIITTKRALTEQGTQMQMLRNHFSDYAYWQPRLKTDADGKARFNVTYPDDITSWRSFVLGMSDHQQAGSIESLVKSFKPLSASLVSPVFAVRGDSFSVLGKVMNYTTDSLVLNRYFKYNGQTIANKRISMQNAHIDTFKMQANDADSLTFEYAISRDNGYFDGERRMIPLFEQGSLETQGSFDVLQKDTTITLQTNPGLKEATLRAESSAIDVLLDETGHLRTYEYLCNEQLASKLKGLLAERQIRNYLKQPFKWDKDIQDIIKKLTDNRNMDGTWGWWKGTAPEMWITQHVIESLVAAAKRGYPVYPDVGMMIAALRGQMNRMDPSDMLRCIPLLQSLSPGINLQNYITDYEKAIATKKNQSEIEKYRLMYVRLLAGMPIVLDSLLKNMHHTMFGNIYWGKKGYNFYDNSISESLMAYRILKIEDQGPLLIKLRNYFLEQRAGGYWRNTYESAEILETILPDMMTDDQPPEPAVLKISGDKNETVTRFPYETKLNAGSKITVSKTGDLPIYLTAYQKFWNPAPKKVNSDFSVETWFEKGRSRITKVNGGQNITLNAEVTVNADVDFVMIEIPIPAGCSYTTKNQGWAYGEVHREYFKNKVSIFCRKLTAGKYKYSVELTPRYGGSYHVNPAKAEMMYFPTFYGREGMKMFDIK